MGKLSYILGLTPRETWRIARLRLPVFRNGPAWTVTELMSSPKHSRGIRFAELLLRQEAIAARNMNWQPIIFEDRRVVEIGCGPLGGFGPMAIFCGATSFESAEPEWDEALFFDPQVIEKYHRLHHADLVSLFGKKLSFDEFVTAMRERLVVTRTGFEQAPIEEKVDVVLSQSVLEHVFPLEDTIRKLSQIQHPRTQFLHLVDFGNHYPTQNPFEGLYDQPASEYIAKRGRAINCLRLSDVQSLFEAYGIAAEMIPSRVYNGEYPGQLHPWWTQRYQDADLNTQLCLVASPGR